MKKIVTRGIMMSLQLVVSHDTTLTNDYVMEKIKTKLIDEPLGKPIFYIVPEQMTFQQEYDLFKDDKIKGSLRAQVVSFSRLAWRVLQEVGGSTRQFISSTGTQMMLRKIIEERTEPFEVFEKATDKFGFLTELDDLITEFKRHQITPELLEEQLGHTTENKSLHNKLNDLHYIYDHLTYSLKGQYIDGEDQLGLLINAIEKTSILQGADIYIDGFHRFTPQELAIVEELLKVAERVTITLVASENAIAEPLDELDLFHQTKETYARLQKLAKEIEVSENKPVFLPKDADELSSEAKRKKPFIHLQQYFDDRPTPVFTEAVGEQVVLAEAVHPRAELEGAIQEILRLVRDEGYRYRDIAIFVRETADYYNLMQTLFTDYKIPVFIDEKRTMLNHPLIEFIRSLFDVIESNWRYDALFRLLKTGFIKPSDETYPLTLDAIDQLENYVLAYGIRSKAQWTQEEDWIYERFRGFTESVQTDEQVERGRKINSYRQQVIAVLEPFDKAFRLCKTVYERTETLYMWLEQLKIPQQLEEKRVHYETTGELEKAREEEQVWQAIIGLFDELVELIGDDSSPFTHYRMIVEAGLEALQFAHVPPSMDHVIVGTIDHSRIGDKKCVFLIGVNEGSWPMKPNVDGMINEDEREFLQHFGLELAASNRRVLLDDNFYMYLAFTLPHEFLWVSYALSDHEGKSKIPSQMVYRLKEFFPELKKNTLLLTDPEELEIAERFITTAEKTRGPLTVQLSRFLRDNRIEPVWWDVLNWYINNETQTDTTYRTLQSLFYKNESVDLQETTIEKLTTNRVRASVSRLEMLHRCSYQYFLNYTLKLKERRTYSLEAPDIGQLFHEALKTITEQLQQEGKDFKDVTKNDSKKYAAQSLGQLGNVLEHHVLSSSNRYRYIKRKLEQVIAQATYVLSEQARASGFAPVGIELGFGYKNELAPIKIPLANGRELVLRGRIDRVDKAEQAGHLYLRIIDYKSSKQQLSLEDVYYGLSLQMLTYLHVVLLQSEKWLGSKASPAGVLYFHVHDAMLRNADQIKEDQIEAEIFKQYKMNGLLLDDPEVAVLMDENLASNRSDIVPVAFKKDGDFTARSKVQDEATFATMRSYVHMLMERAGFYIFSGKVDINPFENSSGNACRFCPFKSVCQFDPVLRENNYRRLEGLTDDEVIKRMNKMNERA